MIKGVSFRLHRGEIVGLAGLIGAGRTEVARLIMGAERRISGTILLNGQGSSDRPPIPGRGASHWLCVGRPQAMGHPSHDGA